jgi:hypothetical protein
MGPIVKDKQTDRIPAVGDIKKAPLMGPFNFNKDMKTFTGNNQRPVAVLL